MAKQGTKRRSQGQKWAKEYGDWQVSGLTQRSYCIHAGLIFTQFKAGVEAARQQGLLERPSQERNGADATANFGTVGFAPVQINPSAPQSPYCEIWFEGKAGIRIETSESLRCFVALLKNGVIER